VRNANVIIPAPSPLNDEQWALLGHVIAGTPVLRKEPREPNARPDSRRTAIAAVQEDFHQLDLQQLRIGTEIPPGAQRVRGIAGSGKTVLLCQKAAHMHLSTRSGTSPSSSSRAPSMTRSSACSTAGCATSAKAKRGSTRPRRS
jgi:hypothetical protein